MLKIGYQMDLVMINKEIQVAVGFISLLVYSIFIKNYLIPLENGCHLKLILQE